MKTLWKNLCKIIFLCGIASLLTVCSANPDPNSIGNCTLSCSDAKIAANNMRIRFLAGNSLAIGCQGADGGQNYPGGSVPIQFVIEQTAPAPLPAGTLPGETAPTPLVPDVGVPAPGISFDASIVAGLMGPDNPDDPSAKYKGIVTSQSEWCTDSCGVGIVEIVPNCYAQVNTVNLQISSGAAAAVSTITVNP